MLFLKPDPMGETRNPFQVFLLCLSTLSGFTLLGSSTESTTGTMEAYLDGWQQTTWALLLISGGLISLLGMYWLGDARNGLFLKRIGFTILSVPVFLFGFVLLYTFGISALTMSCILFGLAAASGLQAYRVNKFMKNAIDLGDSNGAG